MMGLYLRGKHRNPFIHGLVYLRSERLRAKLSKLVKWEKLSNPEPGCTVVLGMCSKLPQVLNANLRCLATSRWDGLKALIISVDATTIRDKEATEQTARSLFPDLPVDFVYYSKEQSKVAEAIMLPCPYAWLSWCNGIREVTTQHVLIHDYDALILGDTLKKRYERFCSSGAKVQGITWYETNGVETADKLATTFEQFTTTQWIRSFEPLDLFNKVRVKNRRSIHFDITLDLQDRHLQECERDMCPMNEEQLVHPSQMIHQYTMFRRFPAKPNPCGAIPLIPFFGWLGGDSHALRRSTEALNAGAVGDTNLLSDGTRINLSRLNTLAVDWALKQMVQAAVKLSIEPEPSIYAYGEALYACAHTPKHDVWKGDFNVAQRRWINIAAAAAKGAQTVA